MNIKRSTSFVLAAALACAVQVGSANAAIKTQWIDYKEGNTQLSGYLVYDDAVTGKRPAVLMAHDRSGFSAGTLKDAELIASLGYVVFAEDIFGKGIVPKDVPEMTKLITIYNENRALMRARASRASTCSRPTRWSMRPRSPSSATASAAPSGSNSSRLPRLSSASFLCTALSAILPQKMPRISRACPHPARRRRSGRPARGGQHFDRASARRQGRTGELDVYSGATHAFTHPQNASEERADREYKVAMERFLKQVLH